MSMPYARDANAMREYQQLKVTSEVEDATPQRLIQMMMDRALCKMALAGQHMANGNTSEKGKLISDAISIISGLQQSLNFKSDEKLASNFDSLYDYMQRRLLEANMRDDEKILKEVSGLLSEIKEAWDVVVAES